MVQDLIQQVTHEAWAGASGGFWPLREPVLCALIEAYEEAGRLPEATARIKEYIQRSQARSVPMKLRLARVHLETDLTPARALAVLDSIPLSASLDEPEKLEREDLVARCLEALRSGAGGARGSGE